MNSIYGILNAEDCHIDVSNSLHGAKCYASRNGYKKISERVGYNVVRTWAKVLGKWVKDD